MTLERSVIWLNLHTKVRPAIVLDDDGVSPLVVVIAGTMQPKEPPRHIVFEGSLHAKEMGLHETTYFVGANLARVARERIPAERTTCPPDVWVGVLRAIGRR